MTTTSPSPRDQDEELRTRQLARAAATAIHNAFDTYQTEFLAVTRRARRCFELRDWHSTQEDAVERLELYSHTVRGILQGLHIQLGERIYSRDLWAATKRIYAGFIARRPDVELAETFFNSVTRRIFTTVGVAKDLEFVWFGAEYLPSGDAGGLYRLYVKVNTTAAMVAAILSDYAFDAPYVDLARDARLVAARLDAHLAEVWENESFDGVEILKSVFYRNKGAYLIGRIRKRNRVLPILLALLHEAAGIYVDAVLLTENEASLVFSFTRSYFHVETERPAELVGFLKSILPLKPIAELYTAIGHNKHGKTALYRALYRHLANSSDKFEIARGARGMVMTVFTLPSYDVVFKVIKDRFAYPKTSTRADVMARYRLVFQRDRVGRMVDAQEFEYLTFSRDRFAPELLAELLAVAGETVSLTDGQVVIKHLYTERRLYPLDLYIKEMSPERAAEAIVDYGNAIRDLAAANIFPGDLFTKNFGVTRQGRVVFYDYDELCLLTDCKFRRVPVTSHYDEELLAEPWYAVGPNDVFPEEFRTFLWMPEALRRVFEAVHDDLYQPEFWQSMQAVHTAREMADVFPYSQSRRFHLHPPADEVQPMLPVEE